tara:strand:+ start:1780 stop:2340 length:561 start_codon:yes stop_codon:yes gene_type:complete
MANITEILGTDSVSSSRPTINNNFELLNDELASVTALLNPTTSVLSGVTNITTSAITVLQNNLTLFQVNSNGGTVGTDFTFNNAITASGKVIFSGVVGSASTATTIAAPTTLEKSTYFVDADFTMPTAVDGHEVMIIATAASTLLVAAGVSLGATSIALDGLNSTITLRCFGNTWYVVSSHKATIV